MSGHPPLCSGASWGNPRAMFRVLVAALAHLRGLGVLAAPWPMSYKPSQRAPAGLVLPSRVLPGAGGAGMKAARNCSGVPDHATAPGPLRAPVSSFQVSTCPLPAHVMWWRSSRPVSGRVQIQTEPCLIVAMLHPFAPAGFTHTSIGDAGCVSGNAAGIALSSICFASTSTTWAEAAPAG